MRDTVRDIIAAAIILAIVMASVYALISFGKRIHAAENCREDEAWIAVSVGTPNSFEDSHGVTRACVNVEDI